MNDDIEPEAVVVSASVVIGFAAVSITLVQIFGGGAWASLPGAALATFAGLLFYWLTLAEEGADDELEEAVATDGGRGP